jgi:uncharacterized membrane protein YeaQ/YmgE (transglycosylase-associated protein family)
MSPSISWLREYRGFALYKSDPVTYAPGAFLRAISKIPFTEARMGSTMMQIVVSLISGAVGGNIAGAIMKNFSLGPIGNTIVGLIGGGLGGQLLSMTGMLQSGGTAADVGGSAVGGAVLMAIVGLIKGQMTKTT